MEETPVASLNDYWKRKFKERLIFDLAILAARLN